MENSRILKELKEFEDIKNAKKEEQVKARVVNDNIRHWRGTVFGPSDTCYTGGVFEVDIEIP